MNKKVLDFVNKLEGYKTAIKQLHWDADNMSQHELCDDIAESIAEFQDTVSEVEQSITGKLKVNSLKPTEYKIKDLKSFVEDVLDATNTFYKEVKDMGDTYVGMASDCESFLSDMQRKLYLVNFTLKEELKERLRSKINEAMYKRIDNPSKKSRSNVTTLKTRINHIYDAVKEHGLDSRLYHDEAWQAIDFYHKVITDKFGGEVEVNTKPCADLSHADSIESDGGYCDYDPYDHMPRSKQYAIEINFLDGMKVSGYIKCMAAGTVQDPFSSYDTCIVLWPKNNRVLENREMRNESINENNFMDKWEEEHLAKASKGLWRRDRENFYNNHPDFKPSDGNVEEDRLHELGVGQSKASQDNRKRMAMVAKRNIEKGNAEKYGEATNSIIKGGGSHADLKDFQEKFEENRQIKLSEAELKQLVKEAAMKILSETPLNYDVDNFSGRWTKSDPSDEEMALADSAANGDYLDNPMDKDELEQAMFDDTLENGDERPMKDIENDYSWNAFDRQAVAQGVDPFYKIMKTGVPSEVDKAIAMRNNQGNWSDRELRHANRVMNKYVHGKYDVEDVGDAWNDLHFESKEPMKVTEAELKTIIKEAAIKVLEKIEIDQAKKGTFKREATKHNKSVKAFAKQVLGNKEAYSPETVKKANFANNFA